jgi:hypothetical protein
MDDVNETRTRLVFLSGSIAVHRGEVKRKKLSPDEKRRAERFSAICQSIGESLGRHGFGIAGCAPHWSRVLASHEASKGLLKANPNATFTTEGMDFPLDDHERSKFIGPVIAGVFIAGTSGTKREFELCKQRKIRPLIPVAGAGGTGEKLTRELLESPGEFLDREIATAVLEILADPAQSPESYSEAVIQILDAHFKIVAPPAEQQSGVEGQATRDERRERGVDEGSDKRWWQFWR